MAKKRRRAAAQQSSDDGESSSDESERGVEELDLEQLRDKLRQQPVEEWPSRDEEIRACDESIRKKKNRPLHAAMSASGCCQCFMAHYCLAVFVLLTAGSLLVAVGPPGTASRPTAAENFSTSPSVALRPCSLKKAA